MLNRIVIIGRATSDPELRYTNSGTAVCTFTLAVDRQKQKDREQETDFINVVVWQKQAEIVAQYLKKGRLAATDGRLQIRTYENKEGQKVRVAEVVAESVRFLDRGDSNGQPSKPAQAARSAQSANPFEDDSDPFASDGDIDDSLPF